MAFPQDFIWGAATSSYQIEGAALQDGRGECIWHRFTHTPGTIDDGSTGDVACDHYHRYREDVTLIAGLGLNAYRFSIAWPRVLPAGTGLTNPAGLDFYDRLVDELLRREITPFVTLYHWDLPQALQERGGWENPDSMGWFRDYAALMAARLGDRVKHWITHNEPWVIALLGNYTGEHAPGQRNLTAAYTVAHHLLLSHGAAVPAIRQNAPGAQVGITLNLDHVEPATQSETDRQAAYRHDGYLNRWFLDAVFHGRYPQDMVALLGAALERIVPEDIGAAAVPLDFLGINNYTRQVIVPGDNSPFYARSVRPAGSAYTAMNWEVCPEGLRALLVRVARDYAPPAIYITENGAAFDDPDPVNGVVEDPQRVDYYRRHIEACAAAIAEGVPLKGYFAWSLMDNFEWARGYLKRFGIVHVDFATQVRTPKRSALFYRDLIAAHHAKG